MLTTSFLAYLTNATRLVGASVLLAAGHQSAAPARSGAGDLLIAPTRVVFEGAKRTAEINLLNIGDKPATYRISLIHERMDEDGKLDENASPAPDEKFADELVRFTPRQVLLEPHIAQIVRIQMRLPAGLDTGEYRSHLLFRAVSAPDAPTDTPNSAEAPKGISISIKPIYGIAIPVIVRHGDLSAAVTFTESHLTATPDGAPVLVGKMSRTGSASVYGDLWVEFAPKGGKIQTLARSNGLAIYTPNPGRNFAVLLSNDKAARFQNGTLRVTYRRPDADGGQVISKTSIDLP